MRYMSQLMAIVVSAGLMSSSAFGAFSVEQLHESARVSVADFKGRNPEHFPHLLGYKVWKADDGGRVKIYVDHGGMQMEFDYACQGGTQITCSAQ